VRVAAGVARKRTQIIAKSRKCMLSIGLNLQPSPPYNATLEESSLCDTRARFRVEENTTDEFEMDFHKKCILFLQKS
jgi:hypothetical protein